MMPVPWARASASSAPVCVLQVFRATPGAAESGDGRGRRLEGGDGRGEKHGLLAELFDGDPLPGGRIERLLVGVEMEKLAVRR